MSSAKVTTRSEVPSYTSLRTLDLRGLGNWTPVSSITETFYLPKKEIWNSKLTMPIKAFEYPCLTKFWEKYTKGYFVLRPFPCIEPYVFWVFFLPHNIASFSWSEFHSLLIFASENPVQFFAAFAFWFFEECLNEKYIAEYSIQLAYNAEDQ